MRVLSLLAVALAGCYDPPIRDCQFTCPDGQCPGDLACIAGVCRLAAASVSCPCLEPPSGCSLVPNSANICLAACNTAQTWDGARTACSASGSWQLAVLDTTSTLSAGEAALRSSTTWIGLHRSSMLDAWTWISGIGSPAASDWMLSANHGEATNTCAAVNSDKLYSDACGAPYPYACTMN